MNQNFDTPSCCPHVREGLFPELIIVGVEHRSRLAAGLSSIVFFIRFFGIGSNGSCQDLFTVDGLYLDFRCIVYILFHNGYLITIF